VTRNDYNNKTDAENISSEQSNFKNKPDSA